MANNTFQPPSAARRAFSGLTLYTIKSFGGLDLMSHLFCRLSG
jgi:hypothetical protein